MKLMVIDVAAEYGGALTILNMFRKKYEADTENEYVFVLSKARFENTENVRYLNFDWVKKSLIHRLWFEYIFVRKLIRKEKPDKILSLQNKAVGVRYIPQDVYFHNVLLLSDRRYSLFESKKLWFYQNPIAFLVKRSLRRAEKIFVQADWIKEKLCVKWKIEQSHIEVERPAVDFMAPEGKAVIKKGCPVFYPAGASLYKNHYTLIKACVDVWDELGIQCGLSLTLTCKEDRLSSKCLDLIGKGSYPIVFTGKLTMSQMQDMYQKTVLVFPSLIETVGLPLIEASLCGSQIIAADLPYARETLGDYKNVVYFDPEDNIRLKEILKKQL